VSEKEMEPLDNPPPVSRNDLAPLAARYISLQSDNEIEKIFTWEQAVRVLRKNNRFVLGVAGFLILGVVAVAFLLKDTYQPKAFIDVDPAGSGIKTLHEIEESSPVENPDYLETQAQILQGEGLAVSVIRVLDLVHNPEFVSASEAAKWANRPHSLSEASTLGDKAPYLQDQVDLANRTALESVALTKFQKKLSVNVVRNSRLIEVSFASHSPELAQSITNTLVRQFIEQNYRNRYTSTMEASAWLSKQIDDLRKKAEAANQDVADYQRKYELVEADDKDVPLGQLMNEVNHQYSDAEANRIEMEAYVRMINQGLSDSIPAVRDDQLYQTLMGRFVDVRAQLAQARAVYGDENSNVKKLEDELKEFAAQLDAERSRILERVQTSYSAARDREMLMLREREKVRSQMGDASSRMVAYRVLKNEAAADAELYNTLRGRLNEAGIYAGLRSSNIHVVDLAANLNKPTSPHRGTLIALGSVLSCMFAVVLAFVRESLDNTAHTPDDMRDWIRTPALAMLPRMKAPAQALAAPAKFPTLQSSLAHGPELRNFLIARPQSAEGEAIRDLRTALLAANPLSPPRVILITSPSAGEGKTTLSVNLALALAHRGTTCLIEGDLRRPAAGRLMGTASRNGLGQVLGSMLAPSEAIVKFADNPAFAILPAGAPVASPGDLMDPEKMTEVVNDLKQKYQYIVIDSPPLIPFSDARLMASVSDAVVLVGRYGVTTRRAITRCAGILEQVHARLAGVVLNDIDLSSADYHYYNYGFSASRRSDSQYYSQNGNFKANGVNPMNGDAKRDTSARGKSAGAS
jgi:capsular exopolysaccharide synthesis family protein